MTVYEKIQSMTKIELYEFIDSIYQYGWSNGYADACYDKEGDFFKFYLDMDYDEFIKQLK